MKTQNNIAAVLTAKLMLTEMLKNGLSNAQDLFALSNVLSEKYNLSKNESIIVIEEALKIA